jgi:uncharacterized membrane protein HdeD (DUF308 family)
MNVHGNALSEGAPPPAPPDTLRRTSNRLMILGFAMISLGIIAMAMPFAIALAATVFAGAALIVGGAIKAAHAFERRASKGFWASILSAALFAVVGILLLTDLFQGVLTLTLLLAVFFIFEGALKVSLALQLRPDEGWGWMLFSGAAAWFLAAIIAVGLPESALWAIGLIVGIDLILTGWAVSALGMAVRQSVNEMP